MVEHTDNLIEVTDLVVKYGDYTVLDGVTFNVRRGDTIVILGGSGSGKSTLLRTLIGLKRPHSGCIMFEGTDFTRISDREQLELRKKMGVCFQSSALFGSMTVAENIAMPLLEHTKLEKSTIDIMVKIKLELVGLSGFEDYMPSELSGGMRKRAGLARAMAMDPEVIFYDEPSAGLDPIVGAGLDELILMLKKTFSITSIVVTHDLASVELIADCVCMLEGGGVVGLGTLDEVKASAHPYVRQFFERRPNEEGEDVAAYLKTLTGDKA